MDFISLQSKNGGGDGNDTSPARSPGVSPPRMTIVCGESGELSSPVVSITFPEIQEKIGSALTDSFSSCSADEFVTGGASDGGGSGGNADKKPVWSKPVNVVGIMSEVMSDASWPSLPESTSKKKPTATKSSSSKSLQTLSDGSLLSALHVAGNSSPKLASMGTNSSPNHVKNQCCCLNPFLQDSTTKKKKAATTTATISSSSSSESLQSQGSLLLPALHVAGNSSPNYVTPSVQNFMLQTTGNSVSEESPASQVPKVESPLTTSAKPVTESLQSLSDGLLQPALQNSTNQISGNSVSEKSPASQESKDESPLTTSAKPAAAVSDSYPKDYKHQESPRGGVGSQPNSADSHHHQQNSYRRSNGRLHPRAGGSYYYNYGGKPGQGQGYGNQAWNHNTNFNNRVTSMPSQRGGYYRHGYIQHLAPFFHSPMYLPVRPSSYNFQYPAAQEHPLHEKIMKQIDYYFSSDNLAKDVYLRRYMDEQGWVSVDLIAGFNKVSSLTKNVKVILDVMQKSNIVEVHGGKMRRRNDWIKWPLPLAVQNSVESQLQGIRLQQGRGH